MKCTASLGSSGYWIRYPPYPRSWAVWRIRIRDLVPFRPLDPGWVKREDPDRGWNHFFGLKHLNSLMRMEKIRIRDKQPGSATLDTGMWRLDAHTVICHTCLENSVLGGESVGLQARDGYYLLLGRTFRRQLDVHLEIYKKNVLIETYVDSYL